MEEVIKFVHSFKTEAWLEVIRAKKLYRSLQR